MEDTSPQRHAAPHLLPQAADLSNVSDRADLPLPSPEQPPQVDTEAAATTSTLPSHPSALKLSPVLASPLRNSTHDHHSTSPLKTTTAAKDSPPRAVHASASGSPARAANPTRLSPARLAPFERSLPSSPRQQNNEHSSPARSKVSPERPTRTPLHERSPLKPDPAASSPTMSSLRVRRTSSPLRPPSAFKDMSMLDASFAAPSIGDKTYDELEVAIDLNRERRKSLGLGLGTRVILDEPEESVVMRPGAVTPPMLRVVPSASMQNLALAESPSPKRRAAQLGSMNPPCPPRADSAFLHASRLPPLPTEADLASADNSMFLQTSTLAPLDASRLGLPALNTSTFRSATPDFLADGGSFRLTPPRSTKRSRPLAQELFTNERGIPVLPSWSRDTPAPLATRTPGRPTHLAPRTPARAADVTLDLAALMTRTGRPKRPSGTEESFLAPLASELVLADLSDDDMTMQHDDMVIPASLRPKLAARSAPPLGTEEPFAGLPRSDSTRTIGRSDSTRALPRSGSSKLLPRSDSGVVRSGSTRAIPRSDSNGTLSRSDSTKGLTRSGSLKSGLVRSDSTKSGLVRSDSTKTGLIRSDSTKTGLVRSDSTKSGLIPSDSESGLTRSNSLRSGLTRSDSIKTLGLPRERVTSTSLRVNLAKGSAPAAVDSGATPPRRTRDFPDVPLTLRKPSATTDRERERAERRERTTSLRRLASPDREERQRTTSGRSITSPQRNVGSPVRQRTTSFASPVRERTTSMRSVASPERRTVGSPVRQRTTSTSVTSPQRQSLASPQRVSPQRAQVPPSRPHASPTRATTSPQRSPARDRWANAVPRHCPESTPAPRPTVGVESARPALVRQSSSGDRWADAVERRISPSKESAGATPGPGVARRMLATAASSRRPTAPASSRPAAGGLPTSSTRAALSDHAGLSRTDSARTTTSASSASSRTGVSRVGGLPSTSTGATSLSRASSVRSIGSAGSSTRLAKTSAPASTSASRERLADAPRTARSSAAPAVQRAATSRTSTTLSSRTPLAPPTSRTSSRPAMTSTRPTTTLARPTVAGSARPSSTTATTATAATRRTAMPPPPVPTRAALGDGARAANRRPISTAGSTPATAALRKPGVAPGSPGKTGALRRPGAIPASSRPSMRPGGSAPATTTRESAVMGAAARAKTSSRPSMAPASSASSGLSAVSGSSLSAVRARLARNEAVARAARS